MTGARKEAEKEDLGKSSRIKEMVRNYGKGKAGELKAIK